MFEQRMIVTTTYIGDQYWDKTKAFAKNCSWVAGPRLNNLMETYAFKDWERVFIILLGDQVIGFSTFTEIDCIPNSDYSPFIGFVFVAETYRGNRLGMKMVESIIGYAKSIGFKNVYVASNEVGLYEKMKFEFIEYKKDNWGNEEQVFVRKIE
jgi:GNAT superfamily N-acetyltransferase